MRVLMAAVLGGILFFMWGAFAHMVLPFEDMVIKQLPNEQVVLSTLATNTPERGMYLFPGMNMRKPHSEAEMAAWEAKVRTGPSGLLVYRPNGGDPTMGSRLLIQFLSSLLGALVIVLALRAVRFSGGYAARVAAITAFGLAGWLSISVPQWNWYGFTTPFLLGDLIDQIGWLVAGLGMAAVLKPQRSAY